MYKYRIVLTSPTEASRKGNLSMRAHVYTSIHSPCHVDKLRHNGGAHQASSTMACRMPEKEHQHTARGTQQKPISRPISECVDSRAFELLKRKLFPGPMPMSPGSLTLPLVRVARSTWPYNSGTQQKPNGLSM